MARAQITEIHLVSQDCDDEGRMTRRYKVKGNKQLNVYTVWEASDDTGNTLPKKGDPNPLQSEAGVIAGGRAVADKFSASQSGTEEGAENVVNCTIGWVLPTETTLRQGNSNGDVEHPWDQPASISTSSTTVSVDMWGTDEKGKPLKYSNGQPVNIQKPIALEVITISRARKYNDLYNLDGGAQQDSFGLSKTYTKNLNSNAVTLKVEGRDHSYDAETLLTDSIEVKLERAQVYDPVARETKKIPYFTENIVIYHNIDGWDTVIPDEGHFYLTTLDDGGPDERTIAKTFANSEDGTFHREPQLLNGKSKRLTTDNYDKTTFLKIIDNAFDPAATTTPQGVPIDLEKTAIVAGAADGTVRMVFLKFVIYGTLSYTPLELNRGLTTVGNES